MGGNGRLLNDEENRRCDGAENRRCDGAENRRCDGASDRLPFALVELSTRLQERVRNSSTFTRHYALSYPSKSYSIFNVIQKDLWLVDLSYLIHLHLSTSLKYRTSAFIHSL